MSLVNYMEFYVFYCQKCYKTVLIEKSIRPHGEWYVDDLVKSLGISSRCKKNKKCNWEAPSWEEIGKDDPKGPGQNTLWWVDLNIVEQKHIDRFDAVIKGSVNRC